VSTDQAGFALRGRNPDVLTCIANLSNDEVFTPPEFANKMLDKLAEAWAADKNGANIWADSNVKFLDPVTKSGVFLREVTRRLTEGLKDELPKLEERVDHILTNQVYGIATTFLTSLLARRSVYCSKFANGPHSIAKSFAKESGNIWFERTEHTWVGATDFIDTADGDGIPVTRGTNGKCRFCGTSQKTLDRGAGLETYAYAFIHTDDIKARVAELFGGGMQFDVIIGNPPYQLQDAGYSASAIPIYHKFIEQAMNLDPRFLTMVTPSRWFVGGKGLDEFRAARLADRHMRVIVDYIVDKDAFPGINVNGGVNYFLWDRDREGDCTITTVEKGGVADEPVSRPLGEFDVFIRRNTAVSILRKVRSKNETTFDERVSPRKPFGLPTNFFGADKATAAKPIKLYSSGKITWVSLKQIEVNKDWVDRWKVLVAAATDGNENYPLPIWDQGGPFVVGPHEACSETYLVASLARNRKQAGHIRDYMRTKFFRFLVSLRKIAQHNKSDNFSFVPDLPMDRSWTDEALFARYGITKNEAAFIDTMIRTMDWRDE
jgi:site-specific DNA-methyltransferase (adenine-specific)